MTLVIVVVALTFLITLCTLSTSRSLELNSISFLARSVEHIMVLVKTLLFSAAAIVCYELRSLAALIRG